MKNEFVRILRLELVNFKNVENGIINFTNYKSVLKKGNIEKTDIMAIYGQNGSGKTAVVEAIAILKNIISGSDIEEKHLHLIEPGCKTGLVVDFFVKIKNEINIVKYSFLFDYTPPNYENNDKALIFLCKEELAFKKREEDKWKTVKKISYNAEKDEKFKLPRNTISTAGIVELNVMQKFNIRYCKSNFFNYDILSILDNNGYKYINLSIIDMLIKFAKIDLFVVTVEQLGHINVGNIMPIYFQLRTERSIESGGFPIKLFGESEIPIELFDLVEKINTQINSVLSQIIPGLLITIESKDKTYKDNKILKCIQFKANRYGKTFNLEYESEGIKRIIGLLSVLIAMMNNPCICLVVDEFDSGLFEFLLGELLTVIDSCAKGQLIFTSHNLHALEVLSKDKIIFSTADSKNRYISLKGIGGTNNLRDFYLRAIYLGTQEFDLYESKDITLLKKAFRKAGRLNEL